MNTRETPIRASESGSTDIIRVVRNRSRTAKIASGVAGGVLSLLPATIATAEPQPLGTTALDSDEIAQVIYSAYPNLDKPVPKKGRFDLIVNSFDINAGTEDIYSKSFTLQRTPGSKTVKFIPLSKIAVVPGIPPANSYFPITNADGTIKHKVVDDGYINVDGEIKYCGYECYYDQENIHPTKTGIKILLYNTGTTKGKNVLRVDDLDADNYCSAPVDTQESTIFQPEAIPEIEFELGGQTHKLRGIAVYKEKYEQYLAQVSLDGVPYDRDASNPNNIKWKPENPVKGNADFIQTEWLNAFTIVETEEGPLIVGAIDAGNVKLIVLEPKIDPETGKVILEECPIEMGEFDPNAPPLDDDGDGIPNSVEEATGGCIGYTDADKVDVNGNGKSDTCEPKCETYANEVIMTSSDSLPCTGEFGYSAAKQLKDGSFIHYSGAEAILADDGTIIAQSGMKMRYIHTTLVGAVPAPESARDVALPDGYNAQIKVNSGTAHVTGFDFLGEPVEVTVTPESGLVDLGFIYGAETGIEGSDIEFTVEGEYQPCQNVACQNQNPEPPVVAEPAQTVETPTQAETSAQAEPPITQVEIPAAAELPAQAEVPVQQPEPVLVAEAPFPSADVVENQSETVDTGSIVIPPPADVTVSSPDVDTVVYTDTPAEPDTKQSEDVAPTGTDTLPDTQPAPDTAPDTPSPEDTADAGSKQDLQAGVDVAKIDNAPSTDASVQSEDTQSGADTLQNDDTNQQNQPDTAVQPDKPKDGGGSGGGCAIENPDDPSTLNALMALGAGIAAWALQRRRKVRGILKD